MFARVCREDERLVAENQEIQSSYAAAANGDAQQETHYQTNCNCNMRRWPGKFQSFFHQTRQRFSHAAAAYYLITRRYTGNEDARIREAGRVTEIFSWREIGLIIEVLSLFRLADRDTSIKVNAAEADPANHSTLTWISLPRVFRSRFPSSSYQLIDSVTLQSMRTTPCIDSLRVPR